MPAWGERGWGIRSAGTWLPDEVWVGSCVSEVIAAFWASLASNLSVASARSQAVKPS